MGWNGSSSAGQPANGRTASTKPPQKKSLSLLRGVLAGALIVAALAGVIFYVMSGDKPATPDRKKTAGASVKTSIPKKVIEKPTTLAASTASAVTGSVQKAAKPVVRKSPAELAAEERYRIRKEKSARNRSIFNNQSDQLLAMLVCARPGHSIPPLPISKGLTKTFKESLKTPIVINEDDSERDKMVKEAVIKAREEVQYLVEEKGMTVEQILSEQQQIICENADVRRNAQKEAWDIYKDGDVEGAQKYVNKINLALQQMGIEQIKMPGKMDDAARQRLHDQLQAIRESKGVKKKGTMK